MVVLNALTNCFGEMQVKREILRWRVCEDTYVIFWAIALCRWLPPFRGGTRCFSRSRNL